MASPAFWERSAGQSGNGRRDGEDGLGCDRAPDRIAVLARPGEQPPEAPVELLCPGRQTGRVQPRGIRLAGQGGDIREPDWGPFQK